MAQTEHMPIYKASCDRCLYLEQVVAKYAGTGLPCDHAVTTLGEHPLT